MAHHPGMFFRRTYGDGGFPIRRLALLVVFLLGGAATVRAQTGLTLHGSRAEGENGQHVTLEFRTEGFWQITEGMGTIQWDSAVIDYVDAGAFAIPAINADTFSRIPEGMLIFDWSSDSALGNTLPDGTILFALTFAVRGAPGDGTSVAFTNGWTALHFESVENINLPFSSTPGAVSVVPEPSAALLVAAGWLTVAMRRRFFSRRLSVPRPVFCPGPRFSGDR